MLPLRAPGAVPAGRHRGGAAQKAEAVPALSTGREGEDEEIQNLLCRYLASEISLSKMAQALGVSRFELTERFERLGVPLRIGPANLDEARAEVRVARDLE